MNDFASSVLITRPEAAAQEFALRLSQAGVQARLVISPLLEIEYLSPPKIQGYRGVLFTSRNGVAAMGQSDLPAWCVGDATAKAASVLGWQAVSAGGDVQALTARVFADQVNGPLLHIRGEHTRGDLAARLSEGGIETQEAVVYRQNALALNADAKTVLAQDMPVILPVFSPRTAKLLARDAPFRAPLRIVAISHAVADEFRDIDCDTLILAERPDANSMLKVVTSLFNTDCRIEDNTDLA
ncbi:uroporphyrinogen-III synthase [Shimia sp.]|uniref:uroporphyrinogen-III synthase n=1 Tax=Shimia sp. TaxID=1954381 RepID=UPI003298B1DC